ncbi:hypothetical protein PATSB16_05510 [Pandoraea thiooxydans]|nr:hypothetical protein PATSB16_05510 [Pandoraea thiooxydans]
MDSDTNIFAHSAAQFATKVESFESVNVKPLRVDRLVQATSARGRRSASGDA